MNNTHSKNNAVLHANRLLTAAQLKAIDNHEIAKRNGDEYSLMQEAAEAAFKIIRSNMQNISHVSILVGAGNNGGDGYVLGGMLRESGMAVSIYALALPKTDSCRKARQQAIATAGVTVFTLDPSLTGHEIHPDDAEPASSRRLSCDLFLQHVRDFKDDIVIDALIGIGLTSNVAEPARSVISALNESTIPVVSLDIPSGLCSDTGHSLGVAVNAVMTITFIAHKIGQFTFDGPDKCGELLLASLNINEETIQQALASLSYDYGAFNNGSFDSAPADNGSADDKNGCRSDQIVQRISWLQCRRDRHMLPPRKGNSHKGDFGHSLLIGGAAGMGGAALIASQAALRAGSGKVSCALHSDNVSALLARTPEVMAHGVRTGLQIQSLVQQATAIGIGPGLGVDSWAELLLQQALGVNTSIVLDADALNVIASPGWSSHTFAERAAIMTPHPGEAARLLSQTEAPWTVSDIQKNRVESARKLANKFQAVVILKGQGTVVASYDGRVAICTDGNAGMSSGGMGDALTGVLVALLAQGLSDWDAAILGTSIHAHAGDQAQQPGGQRGLIATDLMPWIRQLCNF